MKKKKKRKKEEKGEKIKKKIWFFLRMFGGDTLIFGMFMALYSIIARFVRILKFNLNNCSLDDKIQ